MSRTYGPNAGQASIISGSKSHPRGFMSRTGQALIEALLAPGGVAPGSKSHPRGFMSRTGSHQACCRP